MMACETDGGVPVTFPVIDISLLSSEDELQKLSSIPSSCGCFQVFISAICFGLVQNSFVFMVMFISGTKKLASGNWVMLIMDYSIFVIGDYHYHLEGVNS